MYASRTMIRNDPPCNRIGNHLFFGDNAFTYTFTHNQVNQMVGRAVPSAPPISFTYTSDGGLSSDGTWSYAYDAEDQLTSVTSASLTNGAIRVLNTYDYRRRRTSKTVQRLYSTIAPRLAAALVRVDDRHVAFLRAGSAN